MNQDDQAGRIGRLEESQMFADHRTDQLAEQMAALERALRDLSRRLDGLERGIGEVGARVRRLADGEEPASPGSGQE